MLHSNPWTGLTLLLVLVFLVVCVVSNDTTPYTPEPRNPSCTDIKKGFGSCDFKFSFCGKFSSKPMHGSTLQWKRSTFATDIHGNILLEHGWQSKLDNEDDFAFLDVEVPSVPIGAVSRLASTGYGEIPTAACIEFHFATFSSNSSHEIPEIKIYNTLKDGSDHLIGSVQSYTNGTWEIARFHSCVETSKISFESRKLSGTTIVGIDNVLITQSTMDCAAVTTTTSTTTTTTSTTTTVTPITTVVTSSADAPTTHNASTYIVSTSTTSYQSTTNGTDNKQNAEVNQQSGPLSITQIIIIACAGALCCIIIIVVIIIIRHKKSRRHRGMMPLSSRDHSFTLTSQKDER